MTPFIAILAAAKKVGVSSGLLLAICTTESGLKNINNYNDGISHSMGICQVKKSTANWIGRITEHKDLINYSEKDLQDVKKNAYAAAVYLKYQVDRYQDHCKAISAYNAGKYITGNQQYVSKVSKHLPKNMKCQSQYLASKP